MLEQKEDILLEFKRKVNEAILLVSKIPVDQKAEVWNFWELITLTVKLCTQVYVEDSSKQLHYTSQNKIDNDKKLTQTSQPNLIRLKKSPIHHYKLCQDDTQAEESKDYGQDLEHTDNESVKSFVKTLDFTDLISCPGSVDNVSSQDGTCSMFFSPPCSTPSGVALAQSVDSSSCSATPHTPRTGDDDHRYNFSSVSDENVEKILDNDSITKREKDDSVDEIKDITSYSDTEKYLENEIVVFVDHSNDLKSVEHSDTIDEIGTTADEERAEDVKISESEENGVGSQTLQLNEECGDNGKNEANLESCNNQNTSISQVNQKGKENKIPLLKIRKSKKLGEATETFEDKQVSSGVRYLNRKSDRKRTEVRHDEFVYEVVEASHRTAKRSPHSLIVGSGSNKLKCNECGKVLSNRTSLKVHMRQHSGQRPFSCTVCGKTFSTNGNKLRHEKSHKGDKEYQCPECQKWFSSTRSLQIHQRTHTGERPYKCNVCGKRFTQQGSLSAHMDLHNGEKRFLCTVCGKSFTQKSNLESHMLRHDSENKQFKCEHCSYSFFTKAELERHVFKHTKEKPFLCDYCPKSFTRVQYLKEHKTMHVKPRSYSCHKCDETFTDVALLRKHKHWHRVKEYQNSKGEITQSHEQEGEIIEQYTQEDLDIHQTCIVTTSEITGMKQIIMTSDKDLPADLLQQFVDSGQVDSEAMEVTHIVPVVQEMDHDGNLKEAETIDDGSQDVYQITFLDTNSDSENSNIIATVDLKDLKAMNLLANATTQH